MKNTFCCEDCNFKFEDEGFKKHWQDKMYGVCWKRLAFCPRCHRECGEYWRKSSSLKNNFDFDSYVDDLKNKSGEGCNPGGGCCG